MISVTVFIVTIACTMFQAILKYVCYLITIYIKTNFLFSTGQN